MSAKKTSGIDYGTAWRIEVLINVIAMRARRTAPAVDGFNLTGTFRQEYEGTMARLRRADHDGRTFQAALRYTLF
ncbi:hypothetical protein [Massilia putida]|uniref:hypothetical protein n=1 Tax=Massilia putida TaxID=1141883 RepID=UPI0009520A98|nr:hypothetical protein [Massilia putida]